MVFWTGKTSIIQSEAAIQKVIVQTASKSSYAMCFPGNFHNKFRIWLDDPWQVPLLKALKKSISSSMFFLKFLTKLYWRSTFSSRLESYSLHYCKKNYHLLDFLSIFRTKTFKNHKRNWALGKESEIKILNWKIFIII